MRDVDKALADIVAIRTQIAAGAAFKGYGPTALAATGALALLTAVGQSIWLADPAAQPLAYLAGWIGTAILSVLVIGIEMRGRSRRHHSGLADAMIHNAIEQFLPAGAAGALLALVLVRFAPDEIWMLPGLWQILVSLGLFASLRSLPTPVALAAAWYFVAGLATVMVASDGHTLSPWAMGIPFAVGQFLLAAILHVASGDDHADA